MSYYFTTAKKNLPFENAIEKVTAALKEQGFGVLTEIDVKETFKKKLDVEFKKYKILGACNPNFAYKAISSEDKIGVFLPCNVVVSENNKGEVEITAVDPVSSMISVKNEKLIELATEVQGRLKKVIQEL